ncbi:MAG: response regulator, partial [Oceanospirillales bacterium]
MLSDPAINELLQNLAKLYVQRLPKEVEQLQAFAHELAEKGFTSDLLDKLGHQLHGIAGSAGTFGFHEVTESTRVVENLVKALVENPESEVHQQNLHGLIDDLVTQLNEVSYVDPSPTKTIIDPPRYQPSQPYLWLIEDDALQAADILRVLDQFNYSVKWFESYNEAEEAAKHERPDGLILDVIFSREQINAAEKLTRESPLVKLGVPIVLISATDSFNARLKAVRMGALGYMLKPLDYPRLIDRLESVLEQERQVAYRVLIVEDDDLQAQHYAAILTAAGMLVQTLADPTEIMDKLADFRPELVLMDIHMPGCSGAELAGMIRTYEEWVSLPVIYLSAETDLDQQLMAMGRGGDDFITKTITDTRLVASVRVRAARFRKLDSLMSRDGLTGLLKHS